MAKASPRVRGSARPVSLALQGGGAHGAFSWGVLDLLLEDASLHPRAISGASAGAMNAVILAAGWLEGGRDGARAKLEDFWRAVARAGALFNPAHAAPWEALKKSLGVEAAPAFAMMEALAKITSPYDRNPFDFNPLRDLLVERIDFEALRRRSSVELFIAATNVRTGRPKVFQNKDLTVDALMASACLPYLFKAVEIDGEAYWDGGYTSNPAIAPLCLGSAPRDVVIVHINPLLRVTAPRSADEILNRLNEITFNASLLAELRAIALAETIIKQHPFGGWMGAKRRAIRLHSIRADDALAGAPIGSKLNTDWAFLSALKERGREAARAWLGRAHRDVGKRSSIDVAKTFLD